jgi:hypothetical protein
MRERAVEIEVKINSGKSKGMGFTRTRVKGPLGYCIGNKKLPELNSCK